MNEELIKELNKRVIEQYTGVLNDINNKINNLEGIFNAEGLDTEEKNNLEGIITDLKVNNTTRNIKTIVIIVSLFIS